MGGWEEINGSSTRWSNSDGDTAPCVTQERPFHSQDWEWGPKKGKNKHISSGALLTSSSETTLWLRRTESSPMPAELLPDRSRENGTAGADGELQRPRHDCCITQSWTLSASLLRFHAEEPLDYSYLPQTLSNQFPLIETSINNSLESNNYFLKLYFGHQKGAKIYNFAHSGWWL